MNFIHFCDAVHYLLLLRTNMLINDTFFFCTTTVFFHIEHYHPSSRDIQILALGNLYTALVEGETNLAHGEFLDTCVAAGLLDPIDAKYTAEEDEALVTALRTQEQDAEATARRIAEEDIDEHKSDGGGPGGGNVAMTDKFGSPIVPKKKEEVVDPVLDPVFQPSPTSGSPSGKSTAAFVETADGKKIYLTSPFKKKSPKKASPISKVAVAEARWRQRERRRRKDHVDWTVDERIPEVVENIIELLTRQEIEENSYDVYETF